MHLLALKQRVRCGMIETKSQAVSEEVSWNFRRADNHNHYVDDETTSQAVSKEAL